MKLQIENQKMRFRISKQELEVLCSGNNISEQLFLPEQQDLKIKIITKKQPPTLSLLVKKHSFTLIINREAAQNLYASLPNREGLKAEIKLDNQKILSLIFEVDIFTQKKKRANAQ